jgi:D-alanyl-D-alanine carboxypeptidase
VANSDIPAVVTLFEQDGVRHVAAAGLANVKTRRNAQPSDRTWVGSITKSFVAVAVMQLIAERRLSLDDTVEKRLPGWVKQGRRVRIRNLLNHTSGIPNYMEFEPARSIVFRNPRVVIPVRKLIAPALQFNLAFEPGSRAEYSNTNYVLLGEIVQRVTKKPLGRVLRERIFAPLGLRSTTYEPGARRLDARQLHGYEVGGASPRDVSWNTFGGLKSDGAVVSSVRDLAVFFGALIRGRLVTKPLLAKMMTIVPSSHGEGMGLYRLPSPCGRNYFGHTGGTPGYITFAAATRDGRRVVVVAINGVGTNAIEAMGHFVDDLLCR